MSLLRLVWRNLLFHWRGNAAVLLGVVVGAAVLTGALLVGDSLRASLRDRALARLGWVDQALTAPRFFREKLAADLAGAAERIEPAILLRATAVGQKKDTETLERPTQARGVTVLGVTSSFLAVRGDGVCLSAALARALDAKEGQTITLRLPRPGDVPRETALGRKETPVEEWDLRVQRVLPDDDPGSQFALQPGLDAPRNAFVALGHLQERLGQPGRVNALLASGVKEDIQERLKQRLTLEDWGLVLRTPRSRAADLIARYDRNRDGKLQGAEWLRRVGKQRKPRFAATIARGIDRGESHPVPRETVAPADIEKYYREHHPYLSLESRQLLLEPFVVTAAEQAARQAKLRLAPTLVYLCRLEAAGQRVAGVVAALPPGEKAPLGPFLPAGKSALGKDEIALVDWGWKPMPAPGSKVVLSFKPPESHGPAPDRKETFTVAGPLPLDGPRDDPGLTPEFPGITDKDDAADWSLPFDDPAWDQQIIRKEYTESYWDEYRATPRAYIRLEDGQALWSSRFGKLTSVRLAPRAGDLNAAAERFEKKLLEHLDPKAAGLVFDKVREEALAASRGGGFDFSLLFLAFSFFLIASALLLVGLLFRLEIDRRAREVGVLYAEGYRVSVVRGLLLGEAGVLAGLGALLGAALGIVYSGLLVGLLAALWPGGQLRSFLHPAWTWQSLVIGALSALVVSLLTVAWVVRVLGKVPPRALLAGQTTDETTPGGPTQPKWSGWIIGGSLAGGITLLIAGLFMPGHEAQAGTFFGSGALLLTACLAALRQWMGRTRRGLVQGRGAWAVARLGVRNAGRHPARSLLTAGLIASAAFLLVAVESFRRQPGAGGGKDGPDGGFPLVGESDLPVVRDLNSQRGREETLTKLERRLLGAGGEPAEVKKRIDAARELLKETQIVALRLHGGDDASCLNLYQPRRPRVLGVPEALIERGGFVFAGLLSPAKEEKDDPWKVLQREEEGIPALGEANTVTWMLRSKLGGTVVVPDGQGKEVDLVISGLLKDSVFQSSLLVSEERFLEELYPGTEGYQFFLIRPPAGREEEARRLLEQALADRGLEVTSAAERLAAYLAVENTYLSTFQALGGLGLVLGSLGLAVVLLRSVWERRAELALFRALGYRRLTLAWLVLAENAFLLVAGLVSGTASAVVSVLPHVLGGGGSIPWLELLALFALVVSMALAAGAAAVAGTLRAPLVPALRRD
jgi:ABC-type lipoprotein release transport system permease subunit